jgi:hypothetical protein
MLKFADSMRIIPYPEVTVVDVENTLTRKTCSSVRRILCRTPHPLCNYVHIKKFTFVEDDRVETDVYPDSSGMDATDRLEVLRVPNACEISHDSNSTTAIMAPPMAGVSTVHGRTAFTWAVGITLPVSWTRQFNCRNTLPFA